MLSSNKLAAAGGRLRGLGASANLAPGPLDRVAARLRRPLDRAFERRAAALDGLGSLSRQAAQAASLLPAAAGEPARADVPGAPRLGAAAGGQRVLVVSLRGWATHNAYELTIAQALRLRGATVALLSCGGGAPVCELGRARSGHPRPCDRCAWLTAQIARRCELEHHTLASRLPWGADPRRAPVEAPAARQLAASRVSASWLLRTTAPEQVAGGQEILRDFAVASAGVEAAASAILDELAPDVVLSLNGLFAFERAIRALALERGSRAPTYEIAPRGGALVFSQRQPAPDYRLDGLWRTVRERPLSALQREEVTRLLADRARGVGAHERYYEQQREDPTELRAQLGLGGRERVVSLFTNVTWDSATMGRDIGFESMLDWVREAVRLARGSELVLVVRVHPAERRWRSREQLRELVATADSRMPDNVRFVAAEDPLSSYALIDASDLVLAYTTTVGLEAAARGRRVAVAGATHYRERGFTIDLSERSQLAELFAHRAAPAPPDQTELALRYAHMFFLRAMIPFPAVQTDGGRVTRLPDGARELLPGADPYLDWVCERILDGGDFGLPDELARLATGALDRPSGA